MPRGRRFFAPRKNESRKQNPQTRRGELERRIQLGVFPLTSAEKKELLTLRTTLPGLTSVRRRIGVLEQQKTYKGLTHLEELEFELLKRRRDGWTTEQIRKNIGFMQF